MFRWINGQVTSKLIINSLKRAAPVITSVQRFWGGVDDDDDLDDNSINRINRVNTRLQGLIKTGQFVSAVEYWSQYRINPDHTPLSSSTYELMLRLYHMTGRIDAIECIREDMGSVGVLMNEECGLTYIMALLDNGNTETAIQFVQDDLVLRGSSSFIGQISDILSEKGFPHLGVRVCDMYIPTQVIEGEDLPVFTSNIRALGHMGCEDEAKQLILHKYGEISNAPAPLQLALIDVLNLCDKPNEAIKTMRNNGLISICTIKNICYLLESVKRSGDTSLVSDVYSLFWDRVKSLDVNIHDVKLTTELQRIDIRRVYNTMIYLLAIVIRDNASVDQECDLFREMRMKHIQPDISTYEAVLISACYHEIGFKWAENVIKRLLINNNVPTPDTMVSWTQECYHKPLHPNIILKMICLVRLHCHVCDIKLDISQYKRLSSLKYNIYDKYTQLLAVKSIKTIQKMMEASGVLNNTSCYNLILNAYQYTGDIGAVFTCFHDMLEADVSPDIFTYHILVDTGLRDGSHRVCLSLVYRTWRLLLASRTVPDISLINKLIKCCRISGEYNRSFYYLSVLNNYTLIPNAETFQELTQICIEMEDEDLLKGIEKISHTLYPDITINN